MSTKKPSFGEQHLADITTAIGKLAAAMQTVEYLATEKVVSDAERRTYAADALAFLRHVESATDRIALRGVQPVTAIVQANMSPAVN